MGLETQFLLLLVALPFTSPSESKGFVVSVSSPVQAHTGRAATLPCRLSPAMSAEGLEVRWYREDHFDTPLVLYRERKYEASQVASYAGRVSLGLPDAGLPAGNVSLNLHNVTLGDNGDYTCYVSSDHGYDRGIVRLNVIEIGSSPHLSVVARDDDFHLSCDSEGWFPRPRLRWSDRGKDLPPARLEFTEASSGLTSVHSSLVVTSSSEVSCFVGLSDGNPKESKVRLENRLDKPVSASLVIGWVAFAVALLVILALLRVYYPRKKERCQRKPDEENERLLKDVQPTPLEEARTHYEIIELQDGNPYLLIKKHMLRDSSGKKFPDGEEVTFLTAVRGTCGFSAGKHYWEVCLRSAAEDLEPKQSWWVGVTNSKFDHTGLKNASPTSSEGSWFLSSSPSTPGILQLSAKSMVSLPSKTSPEIIGVYLNCDAGELTFYDVPSGTVLASLADTFGGEVFPLFNPGKGDRCPMEILQQAVEAKGEGSKVDQNPVQTKANEANLGETAIEMAPHI